MPTYEYACTACGNEWEFEQSMREDALKDCPKCKKTTARRQISRGAGFILKGSGWYSDLYASSSNKKPETKSEGGAESKSTGGSESGSKSESKSDSKAESKSESKSDSSGSSDGSKPKGGSAAAA